MLLFRTNNNNFQRPDEAILLLLIYLLIPPGQDDQLVARWHRGSREEAANEPSACGRIVGGVGRKEEGAAGPVPRENNKADRHINTYI